MSCKDFRQKKKFDSFRYSRIKTIELICERVTKRCKIEVKVTKSSVAALFDKLELVTLTKWKL